MKSYDETIASVFAKGDAILESRRIRALRIKKISFTVSGLCAAAVVGFSVLHNDAARKAVPKDGDRDSIIIGTDTVVTTVSSPVSNELIVTSATNTAGTAVTAENGSKDNNRTASVRTAKDTAGTTAKVNAVTNGKTASAHNGGSSVVTTETGTSANVSDDERSIDMKKITAITTAFLAGFSALPITANANDNYRFYSFDRTDDKQIIAYMSNGQIDIDYDGNGKFDINDVYQFYLYADGYVVDDSVKKKAEANGDFDGNGWVDPFNDAIVLMKYYIISNPLDTTIFNADNYEPAETTPELKAELDMYYDPDEPHYTSSMYFASNLEFQMRYLGTGYGFMKEMVDSGEISLDVNGDGVFDVADCVDYKIFVDNLVFYDRDLFDRYNETLIEGAINWNKDGIFYGGVTTQPYDEENPCPVDVIKLPEETILRCADVLSKIGCYGGMDSGRYMAYCYLLDNPLDNSYFNAAYFEKYYKGASGYNINSSFVFAARTMENIEYCSNFDKEKFEDDFKQYCKDVQEGKKSEPDMNLDGVVDRQDYDDAIVYLNYTFFPLVNKIKRNDAAERAIISSRLS